MCMIRDENGDFEAFVFEIESEGRDAYKAGSTLTANPYSMSDPKHEIWHRAFVSARRVRSEKAKLSAAIRKGD